MPSVSSAIAQHLVTALEGTATLSAASVVRGRHAEPPQLPFAAVSFEGYRTQKEGGRVPIGFYLRTYQFVIVAWVEVAGDDKATRDDAVMDFMDEVVDALEADRTCGGVAQDMMTEGDAYSSGDSDAGMNLGFVAVMVDVDRYIRTGI